jgi:hypothetical protein
VLLPLGHHRAAARAAAGAAACLDLAPHVGNPAGAANLLQAATSAALLSAGRVRGPGLVVSAGITGSLAALALAAAAGTAR